MESCLRISRDVSVNFQLVDIDECIYELTVYAFHDESAMLAPAPGVHGGLRRSQFSAYCEEGVLLNFRRFVRHRYGGTMVAELTEFDSLPDERFGLAASGVLDTFLYFSLSDGDDGPGIRVSDISVVPLFDESALLAMGHLEGDGPRPQMELIKKT